MIMNNKMIKVYAKVPQSVLNVLVAEAKRVGVSVNEIASHVLLHGFDVIRKEQMKKAQELNNKNKEENNNE